MNEVSLEQIERQAERDMDQLDRLLLKGEITQEYYDEACADLEQWLREEYRYLVSKTY